MAGRHSGTSTDHGHSHSHSHSHDAPDLAVGRLPKALLLAFLAICGIATIIGAVVLFPSSNPADRPKASFAAPGVTFPTAEVVKVLPKCPGSQTSDPDSTGAASQCAELDVKLLSGASKGSAAKIQIAPQTASSGLKAGDRVELIRIPAKGSFPATFSFFGVERGQPILFLTIAFVIIVAAVARLRGLLALVGLGFAGLVVGKFMLPALLQGSNGVGVALVSAAAIMFVVLYLAHGLSLRTSAALGGTLLGISATALIGLYAVHGARLSGVADDSSGILSNQVQLDFQGLLMCAIIIASLGVLNDVTITQASAVWELRAAAPEKPPPKPRGSAMRIGRDHRASTIYTIVFAYTGAALSVL
ncbi:MAG: YibE/F family protein, partial [Marmoricola sp.]|nr:YibE/F family protein [Marmoricola sp.]